MKLPVGDIIGETYNGVFSHMGFMVRMVWMALAAYILLGVVAGVYAETNPELAFFPDILSWFVFPFIAVPWHRYIVLGERDAHWRGYYGRFLLALIIVVSPWMVGTFVMAIGVITVISAAGVDLSGDIESALMANQALTSTLGLILVAALWAILYISLRLSLLPPLVAIRGNLLVREAWRMTEGNCWRLFILILAATLPIALGLIVVGSLLTGLFAATPGGGMGLTVLVWLLIYGAVSLFSILLGVSVLSVSYRRLTGGAVD